jgi:hypothetical protein
MVAPFGCAGSAQAPRRAGLSLKEVSGGQPSTTDQAECDQRRQEDRERFEQAIGELLMSDGWKRWLKARARLHGYSLLISMTGVIDPV